jgi:hypothetical protein
MRNQKKDKKLRKASNKAILASVTQEMAQPRFAKSAQIQTDKQINARDEKIS